MDPAIVFLDNARWLVPFAVHTLLLARLVHLRLARRYMAFALMQVISLLQGGLLFSFRSNPGLYGWSYTCSHALLSIIYFAVLAELFSQVLKEYPGIANLGRTLVGFSLPISLAVSVALAYPAWGRGWSWSSGLSIFYWSQRTVLVSVCLFLASLAILLFWYPIRVPRNTVVYFLGYGLLFAIKAAILVALNEFGTQYVGLFGAIGMWVSAVVMIFLALALRREIADQVVVVQPRWGDLQEDRMRGQLKELNTSLYRLVKRM